MKIARLYQLNRENKHKNAVMIQLLMHVDVTNECYRNIANNPTLYYVYTCTQILLCYKSFFHEDKILVKMSIFQHVFHYEQTKGAPMGGCVTPPVAEVLMRHEEDI